MKKVYFELSKRSFTHQHSCICAPANTILSSTNAIEFCKSINMTNFINIKGVLLAASPYESDTFILDSLYYTPRDVEGIF